MEREVQSTNRQEENEGRERAKAKLGEMGRDARIQGRTSSWSMRASLSESLLRNST